MEQTINWTINFNKPTILRPLTNALVMRGLKEVVLFFSYRSYDKLRLYRGFAL